MGMKSLSYNPSVFYGPSVIPAAAGAHALFPARKRPVTALRRPPERIHGRNPAPAPITDKEGQAA